MLNIAVCEDNLELLSMYEIFLKQFISKHTSAIRIALLTGKPTDIMEFSEHNVGNNLIYILDIEFSNSLNKGIEIANKIRAADKEANIIFITTHNELEPLALKNSLNYFDFIEKDNGLPYVKTELINDIQRIMDAASGNNGEYYEFKIGSRNSRIPINNILYFESIPNEHKVTMYSDTSFSQFYNNLASIEPSLKNFFRVHKSYLVNLDRIQSIDTKNLTITLDDGSNIPISRRQLIRLKLETEVV